jgi:adenine-specific DNA-methyltransferase
MICNPPYVRHHHIINGEKFRLQDASKQACRIRIGGLAGLYCYFLALAHPWLTEDGVAAWLIPSEFMDVNYGRAVKSYLLTEVNLLRIHRFDPNDVQFGDALVSSAIVIFRKGQPTKPHEVEFTFGGTLAKPKMRRLVSADALRDEHKWTRFPVSDIRDTHAGVTLGDLFKIKRGLATGDNSFFILTRQEIEDRELPWEFFRPILPSPRYLLEDQISADKEGHPAIEKQVFLLDCSQSEEELKVCQPKLWAYLQTGKPEVSERYLSRHRKPWYSQENRPPTPLVCTYLGRNSKKNGGRPFRFILNESEATAANVYLLLYPITTLTRALAEDPSLARNIWTLLNSIPIDHLLGEGRVYGGGLHKLEPKELANVPADHIAELLPFPLDCPATQPDLFAHG